MTSAVDRPTDSAQVEDRASRHWGLAGTIAWGVAIAIAFVLVQAFMVGVVGFQEGQELTDRQFLDLVAAAERNGVFVSIATFATTVVGCALVAGVIKLKRGSNLADYLALRAVPAKTLLLWLGALIVFAAISDLLSVVLGRPVVPDFMKAIYATARPVWLVWAALLVAAPVFEEVFFRGFLFRGFAASFIGPIGAVALTAALWALIHTQYDLFGIATVFCLGLLIGAARMLTRSLWVPIAMHAMANFVSTLEAALMR